MNLAIRRLARGLTVLLELLVQLGQRVLPEPQGEPEQPALLDQWAIQGQREVQVQQATQERLGPQVVLVPLAQLERQGQPETPAQSVPQAKQELREVLDQLGLRDQ